ncbi:hypothetical protein GARC_2163 [Paraglaciecola arctica BSs20135]|uniref:Uncharacterized protein n=1 Tax=Paraglaciecola arctica BSs20135 TaxID=493475 RepID=K6Z6Q7_9ALTE|nr:hypothetical protein GARC_2163 [Paraglaciecola arctica BSs20135]
MVLSVEFPDLCVSAFKETINNLVDSAEITQCFNTLSS